MAYYGAPNSVRSYNVFKAVGALILTVIVVILLLAGRFGRAATPEATEVAVVTPTQQLKAVETPVDTATPVSTLEAPTLVMPEVGEDGAVALRGTGAPGSIVELWANGKRLEQVTVGDDGTWSFDVTFDPGEYDVSVRVVDAGGELLAESEPATVVVEAPKVEVLAFTSPSGGEEITGDTVELMGTGQPGAEIEILDQGEVIGTATVQDDGTWVYTYDVEPGAHALAVRNAGDDASASEAVSIDVVAEATEPADVTELPEAAADLDTMEVDCGLGDAPEGIDLGDTYIVAPCEYMGLIAARTGVTLEGLIAANPDVEDPALIFPGQVLNLPPR